MRLKTKIFAVVAAVFLGHFALSVYLDHKQTKSDVINESGRMRVLFAVC